MSATRTEGRGLRARSPRLATTLGALVLLVGGSAGAQETPAPIAWLGLDRLRLTGVGATYGAVKPSQIDGTQTVGVHADYGEVARQWRMVFGVTYWGSQYADAEVRRFADSIRAVAGGTPGEGTADVGEVRVTVLALTADARWSPRRRPRRVRPYVGGSFGGYATNVEGRAISGTFLEAALDNISAGVGVVAGADVFLIPNLTLGMHARYDVLSGTRFATLRAGVTYIFRAREGV